MDDRSLVAALLRLGEAMLKQARIGTARLDAELLLALSLGTDRAGLYARLRDATPAAVATRFGELIARRAQREPLAYILGRKEFRSLDFTVTPAVLIPRPETEHVVEIALAHLADRCRARVCDVGTGSGCIAVALAHALPTVTVLATDISPPALRIARQNAERHGVASRIQLVAGNLLAPLTNAARFDAILSNPPYLRPHDRRFPELDWEPQSAFAAGRDGMALIVRLIAAAPDLLEAGGLLAVEIGSEQSAAAMEYAHAAGLQSVSVQPDLAGIPRVLIAQHP